MGSTLGFAIWLFESLLALAAAYVVATRAAAGRGIVERGIVTILVSTTTILIAIYACALAHELAPVPLAGVALLLHGVILAVAVRGTRRSALLTTFLNDAGAPARLLREFRRERELAGLCLLPAVAALLVSSLIIWFYRSWTWDPTWYHVPITNFAIQTRSIDVVLASNAWTMGFPRNVEMLAVWDVIFPMHHKFDDLPQLPFAFLGALGVAAFCRRAEVRRTISVACGAMWIAMPAVFLQIHSTHVDVAVGALLIVGVYYMTQRNFDRLARWMTLIAFGLYAGTKTTGLFHGALVLPWVAGRMIGELRAARGRRGRLLADMVASLAVMASVGFVIYIRNLVLLHNPIWPLRVRVPILGWNLPGEVPPDVLGSPPFFSAPGSFQAMLKSWYTFAPAYCPDVRTGGFGLLFQFLTLPCIFLIVIQALRGKAPRVYLPVLALFVLSVVGPSAWSPRHTIGIASAAIIAFGMVHSLAKGRLQKGLLSIVAVGLTAATYVRALPGYIAFPTHFARAVAADDLHRATIRFWDPICLPEPLALLKETELRPGDVVVFDEHTAYISELWTRDYRNRLIRIDPGKGGDAAYAKALREAHPRWMSVGRGSPAERFVLHRPGSFSFLSEAPHKTAIYRVNDEKW